MGFKGKRSFQYFVTIFSKQFQLSLGKIDAISSDYSLNGLCGLRSLECLWVAASGSQSQGHRFTDMLLVVISVYLGSSGVSFSMTLLCSIMCSIIATTCLVSVNQDYESFRTLSRSMFHPAVHICAFVL